MYHKYYLLFQADKLSFAQTASLVQSLYPSDSIEKIFSRTYRLKRGIVHTGNVHE